MRLDRWARRLQNRELISFRLEFFLCSATPETSLHFMHSPIRERHRNLSQEGKPAAAWIWSLITCLEQSYSSTLSHFFMVRYLIRSTEQTKYLRTCSAPD